MAYKNTEGNSSIVNQMGTWRYFNSSLEKLGTYKPATISVNPTVKPPQQEVDWAAAAWGAAKGAMGLFQARRQVSYKKADEYLRTHSVQEYKQAMLQGNIPFQDDPLAMQRLRYDHGKLMSQLAHQEFQAKIDKGEYVGLQPQELDAKYFEFFREQTADVNSAFGYDTDDYWFQQGLYESTPKARLDAGLKNMAVTNKWQTQKGFVLDTSKFTAIAASSQTTTPQIIDSFSQILQNPKYAHYSPEQQTKLILSGLKSISGRADGPAILAQLQENDVPIGGTYVKLKDLVGQVGWKDLQIQAQDSAWKSSALQFVDDRRNIDNYVSQGDYRSLRAMLQEQLALNGNNYTSRAKYLESAQGKAINQAVLIQHRNEVRIAKEQQQLIKDSNSQLFIQSLKNGAITQDYRLADISTTDIQKKYVGMVKSGVLSLDDQMAIAANHTGGYNPARSVFKQISGMAMRDFDSMVAAMQNNPKEAMRQLPKNLQQVVTLYQKYGAPMFDNVFSQMSAHDKQIVKILSDLSSTGGTYTDVVRSCAQIRQMSKTQQGRDQLARVRDNLVKVLDLPDATGDFFDQVVDTSSGYAKDTLYGMTTAYMRAGKSMQDALEASRQKFQQNHVGIVGTAVPMTFFAIPNTQYSQVAQYVQKTLEDKMKTVQGAQVYYDSRLKKICLTDINNRLQYSIDTNTLSSQYKKYVLQEAKKTPTSLYNKIATLWKPN